MKRILKNKYGEYRCGLQIGCVYISSAILQIIIPFIFGIVVGIVIGFKVVLDPSISNAQIDSIIMSTMQSLPMMLFLQSMCCIIGIVTAVVFYPAISKTSIAYMGLTNIKKEGKDLLKGLGLGILLISILVAVLTLTGDYEFAGFNISIYTLLGLIMYIFVGFNEEIMVRGVFQHAIHRRHSIIWAILIPSILFSIMHFGNPNIGKMPALNLFLAGILFGMITYKTGNLWMGIGLHITWNYTMGNIFGIEVSGMDFGKGLIQMERTADTILNGGNFGLEGGYLCTILLCLVILGISMMKKRDVSIEDNKEIEISEV